MLYELNDSDLVQNAIGNTGVIINWTLNIQPATHKERVRALRSDIEVLEEHVREYLALPDSEPGSAQTYAAKELIEISHSYLT